MAKQSVIGDQEILQAALVGLESQRSHMDEVIREIRAKLGVRAQGRSEISVDGADAGGVQAPATKRRMSAAARKRIGEATRRRWTAFRKAKAEAEKPAAKPKWKLNKVGRAAMIAATKKRSAAVHKAQKVAAPKKTTPKRKAKKSATKSRITRVLASIPIAGVLAPVMP